MAIKNAQIISVRFLMKYLNLIEVTSKNADLQTIRICMILYKKTNDATFPKIRSNRCPH